MSTPRTAFKIDTNHPGSDVAGETAAALAAAAKAFRPYDSMYADLLLLHAKQLFTFADTFRGRYDDSLQSAKKFYPSESGYQVLITRNAIGTAIGYSRVIIVRLIWSG
jgi:hypothetical protein